MYYFYDILPDMKRKIIDPRFPISAALKENFYLRLERLRDKGWKISQIFILGIETAEKKK